MSYKVAARVWEHSRQRGTTKLLLLALAEYASDNGVCWPSAATLAARINETERYTRLLIKELIDAGDLASIPGGGRGKTTRYAILTGLSKKERERLNSVLQNSVLGNTEHEKTVYYSDKNSVLQYQKTVYYSDEGEAPNSASGRAKVPQKENANRHEPSIEPSLGGEESTKQPPHAPAVALFFKTFPEETLSAEQTDDICSTIGNLAFWQEQLTMWRANGYRPRVGNMLDRYKKDIAKVGTNGTHQSNRPRTAHPNAASRQGYGYERPTPSDPDDTG